MFEVSPVRVFADDYIWVIRTPGDLAGAAIVDPGTPAPSKTPSTSRVSGCADTNARWPISASRKPSSLATLTDVEPTLEASRELRSRDERTRPSTIGLERRINPFLRCREPSLRAAAMTRRERPLSSVEESFAVIRSWKDGFR